MFDVGGCGDVEPGADCSVTCAEGYVRLLLICDQFLSRAYLGKRWLFTPKFKFPAVLGRTPAVSTFK
jgi:hypothetical protein